ncbi:MAG: cell wall-active antibiotics response protein [Natronospirillum sp.]|uniref:LiaF transmembrane domain-containing protein n=1 Tax=Natronospirillum sp. TaxID=2812955 RepID=UPI0025E73E55|nr:DUF5668 domain-containing protein [Natronospirillum sp.]MCH8553386.1 cell wall-active antibiotics response protein [Natronospirillum sp.]
MFGSLLVAVGAVFLLNALGIIDVSTLISNWGPLLIIVVGLISLANNPRAFIVPVAIIAIGALLLLNSLDIIEANVWQLIWPIAIIGFGLSLLIRRSKQSGKSVSHDDLDATVVFSGLEMNNSSDNFKGGVITAIFGGAEIDLRNSKLQGDATIEVFAAFGGIELKVPKEWDIHVSGIPVFGGIEDGTSKPEADSPPRLYLKGTCLFGGVEISN